MFSVVVTAKFRQARSSELVSGRVAKSRADFQTRYFANEYWRASMMGAGPLATSMLFLSVVPSQNLIEK